jgi:serine/threonine-protein kinase
MAQVFRAHDEQTGKTVAIKQLLVELSDDKTTLERFEREATSLRALNHPNIVHFYELFQEEHHRYLVIEFVRGGTLSQLMHREGRSLSAQIGLSIMLGVIDALEHAHRHGIIHRDVKPGNVLLTPDYTPRLADFGVALLLRENRMTETGLVVGTIPYMSPEVCAGDDASPASDLWSAGVMFFEMLTGYLPFNGPNPAAIINAIMTAPLPDLRSARPDIAGGLLAVIMRLLTRELPARYTDAGVVAAALRALRL